MEKIRRYTIAQGTAIVLSLIMAFTIFPMTASAETGNAEAEKAASPDFVPGQLIVVTEQGTSKTQMKSLAKRADAQVETTSTLSDGSKVTLIEVEEGGELETASELEREDEVLFVQPNYIYRLDEEETQEAENESETDPSEPDSAADELNIETDDSDANELAADIEADADEPETKDEPEYPNDPGYTRGFHKYLAPPFEDGTNAGTINAKGAWDKLKELDKTNETVVAVLDTGVIFDHEDLQDNLLKDKCVAFNNGVQMGFDEDDGSNDDGGHGTQVAGVLAADFNNGTGISGVAGEHVKIFVVDVETRIGEGLSAYNDAYSIDIALGIDYAVANDAKIINMSFGHLGRDYICERAMKAAWDNGTLCVCSAGNIGTPLLHYPGDSPYAITVMSHTLTGEPVYTDKSKTNYGIEKDISAPGQKIEVTGNLRPDSYGDNTGTSFASPIVAGSAVLLLTAKPNLTPREIKNLLYTSTGEESFSPEKEGQGFGRINVNTAMENLLAEKTAPKKIVINKPSIEMFKGTNTSIEYAVYPGNTNKAKATFTTSNKKIATVNAYGIVTAKAPGRATITVKCGNVSTKSKVTVKKVPYKKIDRKPYIDIDYMTMDDMMDVVPEVNENGVTVFESGYYCHQYRVNLEKNETIQSVMTILDGRSVLRIKDKDGKIVASDYEIKDEKKYAAVTYTAEKAGTYVIQTIRKEPSGIADTQYKLVLTSDKGFCEPTVDYIGEGVMFMSWPAVEGAYHYIVRKYADKDLKDLKFERTVQDTEFNDINFDDSKANYYTVTSGVKTKAGIIYNAETPFFIKLQNPMTAEGKTYKVKRKTLKKRSVYLSRIKVMTLENVQGTLTYKKSSGNKRITINKKTGKVKVRKGLKKGKYRVKVKVKASGNDEYDPITQTVTFWIRVR